MFLKLFSRVANRVTYMRYMVNRLTYTNTIRYMATDADIKKLFVIRQKQVNRISLPDSHVTELIRAIEVKAYKKAETLVKQQGVNVDGHNWKENTPLTNAAENGDTQGVEFLIKHLGANPHASCDCPHHKTALHYASEKGHEETVAGSNQRSAAAGGWSDGHAAHDRRAGAGKLRRVVESD